MTEFQLHSKLKTDCQILGTINNSWLLLMNNSLVPWFIIVPQTSKQEIHELAESDRTELYTNINLISEFVANHFEIDKINVASIGNVVNQMHIHVVGRRYSDFCWPNVVWGQVERVAYKDQDVHAIVAALNLALGSSFSTTYV